MIWFSMVLFVIISLRYYRLWKVSNMTGGRGIVMLSENQLMERELLSAILSNNHSWVHLCYIQLIDSNTKLTHAIISSHLQVANKLPSIDNLLKLWKNLQQWEYFATISYLVSLGRRDGKCKFLLEKRLTRLLLFQMQHLFC